MLCIMVRWLVFTVRSSFEIAKLCAKVILVKFWEEKQIKSKSVNKTIKNKRARCQMETMMKIRTLSKVIKISEIS